MLNPPDLSADAPWKKRFRAPAIAGSSRAAQNPARGLVASNKDGVYQLYAWDTRTDCLTQLTHDRAGVPHGSISADGEYVYYLRDQDGDEIGHYVRLPFTGGETQDITPNLPAYASFDIDECVSGQAIGFTAADDAGFHIYLYLLEDMLAPVFSLTKHAMSMGPYMSHDAEIAVIASTEKTGVAEYALEAYDVKSGALIAELWDGAGSGTAVGGFSPLPGDMRFAGSSSAGGYHRPFIWNPVSGERHNIESELFRGDVKVWHWSPDAERLLLRQVHHARHTLFVYDLSEHRARKLDTPPGVFSPGSGFLENDRLQVHLTDSTAPTRLLELDANSGQVLRKVMDLGVDVPAGSPWRSVTFPSSGGAEIQAWLATPPGDGPFPTIVHTHGGPTAVQTNMWKPDAQAWLDHGFAFFSLNYRGSTTFGYEFQHAIDGNLGDLEVDDIAAGVSWLLESGIAEPGALLKTGTSYGGYLTLQALGRRPELFAGGMAIVAIADWTLMYEDQAGTLRGYQRSMFGGTPAEKPEAHRKASPITYAADIQAPILVLQGENDTRCPARQMRVYEKRLNELGKSIEIYWFDAGHGSLEVAEQIKHQELMLEFAYSQINSSVAAFR